MNGYRFALLFVSAILIYFGGVGVVRFYSAPEIASTVHADSPHSVLPGAIALVAGIVLAGYCVVEWVVSLSRKPKRREPISAPIPVNSMQTRTLADGPVVASSTAYGTTELGPRGRPLHAIATDRPIYRDSGTANGNKPQTAASTATSTPPLFNPYGTDDEVDPQ